jgi:hypothetical protein
MPIILTLLIKRYIDDPERHARFTRFNHGQITELGNLKRMD